MLQLIEAYEHKCEIFLAYAISDNVVFFMFGVPNAKNLAFGTPDANALS